jgi:hypothetical protein
MLTPARGALLTGLAGALVTLAAERPPTVSESIRFNRDIRPILSENCYQCHGPDKDQRKAKLRLDTKDGLFDERDGRAPVAPGHPADSELFRRITTQDPDDRMPPVKTGKTLSGRQVSLLKTWIEQGATWEGHWAYNPRVRPRVPQVKERSWPNGAIDRFILARLEQEGLTHAPEADRRTLLRRLSFDLTGLPPTPEEVAAFARDRSEQAYERLVERLLFSPHYGERLAAYWLDLVRYADTDGFHADNYRSVHPYRNYVIDAFNSNLGWDRMTIEQLAGDLLPNATLAQRVASTYNRLGRTTEEGGAQPKEYLAKYAADRVRTTATVWLGATMGCAECHDHKYDPYTTKDFYRLAAFFADIKEQGVGKPEESLVPNEEQAGELRRFDRRLADLEGQLKTVTPELARAQRAWEERLLNWLRADRLAWSRIKPVSFQSEGGATLSLQDDLSLLAGGENPTNDTYTVTLQTDLSHVTAIKLEALTHPSLDKQSLSRGGGNFVLTSLEVEEKSASAGADQRVPLASAIADFSQDGFPVTAAIDDQADTGWAVAGHDKAENRQAAFIFAQPLTGGPGTTLTVRLRHQSQFKHHNVGRFRLSLISVDRPTLDPFGLPNEVVEGLRQPPEQRSQEQTRALERFFLANTPALDAVRDELGQTRKQKEAYTRQIPRTLMTVAGEPRITRVLPRGNWMIESGEIVSPWPPEFLCPAGPGDQRASRLDLARWLVSPDNPLPARVFMNRLWKLCFGVGIYATLDDCGAQGEWPTHPELLDWLAAEFIERGWDVKHMLRLMVMSRTYRQSSAASEKLLARDPYNRLLARQTRFRLPAEMVRDNALAVSGLLADRIGGPSVKPYQPAGYWDQLNFPKRTWENDMGEALYRRGLYTFWCRTFLHPSLMVFDACTREESTVDRSVSNTPLQALALLNDPTYVEAARAFAERIVRRGGQGLSERLRWACHQALARSPGRREFRVLADLYRRELTGFAADPASAEKLLQVGDWPSPHDLNGPEVAAWTSVARALLSLHESIVRY